MHRWSVGFIVNGALQQSLQLLLLLLLIISLRW